MKRTNGEILRDLRKKNGLTMEELGNKLGRSTSFINSMEKSRKPIPDEILEKIILLLRPTKQDMIELRENIIERQLPKILLDNKKNEDFDIITNDVRKFKLKTYSFDSNGNGEINLNEYIREEYMLEIKFGNHVEKNCIVIRVKDKKMYPYFVEGDILVFDKEKFVNWTSYDKKIVMYKKKGKYFIKKLIYENAIPFLVPFNSRLYAKEMLTEDIEYIAFLKNQIEIRDFEKVEFL